jgi:hypothetical protein
MITERQGEHERAVSPFELLSSCLYISSLVSWSNLWVFGWSTMIHDRPRVQSLDLEPQRHKDHVLTVIGEMISEEQVM